jgi:N-6 DNA Methylase/HsdM N-terminal domain
MVLSSTDEEILDSVVVHDPGGCLTGDVEVDLAAGFAALGQRGSADGVGGRTSRNVELPPLGWLQRQKITHLHGYLDGIPLQTSRTGSTLRNGTTAPLVKIQYPEPPPQPARFTKGNAVAVALKKSDLYSSLWKSCDELRGGMDASQYKDYILTLLFMKYVSGKAKASKHSMIDVPAGASFDDMAALKGDKEIGDKINKIIAKLAEANGLEKVIDLADFNDEEKLGNGKEMQDRLSNLVAIFEDLDFRGSKAEGDDLLGDAYEYLMRHFATEAGKSKGQFYTPADVSRVMAKLLQIPPTASHSTTVYDPTCGSGSMLIKVAAEAPNGLTIYGQEKDNATWALAEMNMILHGNEDPPQGRPRRAKLVGAWRCGVCSFARFRRVGGSIRLPEMWAADLDDMSVAPAATCAWSSPSGSPRW